MIELRGGDTLTMTITATLAGAIYRLGFPDNFGEEVDSTFTRLDHVEEYLGEARFDVMWHRQYAPFAFVRDARRCFAPDGD